MKIKKLAAAVIAVIICGTFSQTAYCEDAAANVNVYPSEDHKNISPYIYGVNSGVDLKHSVGKVIPSGREQNVCLQLGRQYVQCRLRLEEYVRHEPYFICR